MAQHGLHVMGRGRTVDRGAIWVCLLTLIIALAGGDLTGLREEVRGVEPLFTAIPRPSLNYLPLYVAERRGLFREQGIDHRILAMNPNLGIAAMLKGGIDFSGAGDSSLRAAMQGAPLKGLLFQTERVTWFLMGAPGITQIQDLKGRNLGVTSIGSSTDVLITLYAKEQGVNPRDFNRVPVGPFTAPLIAGMKGGTIHMAALDPDTAITAKRAGMNTITYMGESFEYPFQGYVTTLKRLEQDRELVKRWLRGMVKGLMITRDRPAEAVEVAMHAPELRGTERTAFAEALGHYTKAMAGGVPGLPSEAGLKRMIRFAIQEPLNLKGEIPINRLFDFSPLREVQQEFR